MAGPERLGIMLTSGGSRGLTLNCRDCGHQLFMAKEKALDTFGGAATPMQITRRIRCSRCGSRKCWPSA